MQIAKYYAGHSENRISADVVTDGQGHYGIQYYDGPYLAYRQKAELDNIYRTICETMASRFGVRGPVIRTDIRCDGQELYSYYIIESLLNEAPSDTSSPLNDTPQELYGSPKQIAWANELRASLAYRVANALGSAVWVKRVENNTTILGDDCSAKFTGLALALVNSVTSAKTLIDARNISDGWLILALINDDNMHILSHIKQVYQEITSSTQEQEDEMPTSADQTDNVSIPDTIEDVAITTEDTTGYTPEEVKAVQHMSRYMQDNGDCISVATEDSEYDWEYLNAPEEWEKTHWGKYLTLEFLRNPANGRVLNSEYGIIVSAKKSNGGYVARVCGTKSRYYGRDAYGGTQRDAELNLYKKIAELIYLWDDQDA